jgi:hypothetical protein
MSRNLAAALVACVVMLAAASACMGQSSAIDPPKESVVLNDLTQQQATDGVHEYARMISTQLPPRARLGDPRMGTVKCHTPDGNERTGQEFVAGRYFVEGVDPAREVEMLDQLRATWRELGYQLVEDTEFPDGDQVPTFATPGDDYHLTVWLYGDHRSVPLVIIESPCAWPDPAPTSTSSSTSS